MQEAPAHEAAGAAAEVVEAAPPAQNAAREGAGEGPGGGSCGGTSAGEQEAAGEGAGVEPGEAAAAAPAGEAAMEVDVVAPPQKAAGEGAGAEAGEAAVAAGGAEGGGRGKEASGEAADPVKLEALNEEFHKGYLTKNVVCNFMNFSDKGVEVQTTPDDFRMIVDVEAKTGLMNRLEALGGE
ncbi:hypothetical protein CYMTET_55786 [Cymbomonas tetramitiformis]|uniref:Uncharacterized protein n=1 Tax=Cymbomonas tetramitiformis TaxID=36881 RepID=A0AAE0BDZ2_9CHLO|nr:hypothetical protein CYMTET_55786 [Cymbomonas tetramitiformis]